MKLRRSSGIVLHPTSLPGGQARRRGVRVRRLARRPRARAGGRCCRSARPTTSARRTRRRRRSRPGAASSPSPTRPSRRRARRVPRGRTRYWIEDWERAGGSVADQVRFEREWTALREYARERGVGLIGDVPIYVAQGSVDHLAHPELFLDGLVAGAPPDPLGPLGQHWGNPLFDWDAVAKDGYRWWIERLRRTLALFDLDPDRPLPRLRRLLGDPGGRADARTGHWLPGPRRAAVPGGRGRARPVARDRRGPGPDHAGRRQSSATRSASRGWS